MRNSQEISLSYLFQYLKHAKLVEKKKLGNISVNEIFFSSFTFHKLFEVYTLHLDVYSISALHCLGKMTNFVALRWRRGERVFWSSLLCKIVAMCIGKKSRPEGKKSLGAKEKGITRWERQVNKGKWNYSFISIFSS